MSFFNINNKKSTENDEINENDYVSDTDSGKKRRKRLYPHEYPDPCDVYYNEHTGEEEYYFNLPNTLNAHHLGLLWKILPHSLRENIEDFVWNQDWLHDISIKQHEKSEYLNSLTASRQLAYDIKVLFTKILVVGGIAGVIVGYNMFIATPNRIFAEGNALIEQKHYPEAILKFQELDGRKNAELYIALCTALDHMSQKRYDEARYIFEQLVEYGDIIGVENIEEYCKEVDYQQAINYYNNKEWSKAIEMFVPIIKYKNSVEYYEKCQYNLADNDYENMDYYQALDRFSKITTYKDTEDRMNGILSNIYSTGLEKYNENDYMGAAEVFNSIVGFNYKDADQMSTQCFYKSAQDKFDEGEYHEAVELFSQILHYKDSQTMVKECYYRMLNDDRYQSNILNLLALRDYKDVSNRLETNPNNLYGEWRVTEIDNRAANNEIFIFNPDNEFECSEDRLPNVAVSKGDTNYPYQWNGECFQTSDSRYKIYIDNYNTVSYTSGESKYITLRCIKDENESIYKCQKINNLDEYYTAEIVVNAADTSDYDLIQTYLDKLKEAESSIPSESAETDPDPMEPSEDIPGINSEENLYRTVTGTVTKIYDDGFLFVPDEGSEEASVSNKYVVLYEHSTELYKGDVISVIYQDEINTETTPFEITAHRVEYIESSEPEISDIPADTASDGEDDHSGFGGF